MAWMLQTPVHMAWGWVGVGVVSAAAVSHPPGRNLWQLRGWGGTYGGSGPAQTAFRVALGSLGSSREECPRLKQE